MIFYLFGQKITGFAGKNLFGNTKVDETFSDKIIEKTKQVLGEKKIRTKYFSGISSGK